MRIIRFVYLILSVLAVTILFALSISYGYKPFITILMILVVIPNYFLRSADRKLTSKIIFDYSNNCDPDFYIDEMRKYRRRCILSKKQKLVYRLYDCVALIDAGRFDEVLEILLEIDNAKIPLDDMTNILYLKNWCEYFYYNNYDIKLKASILRLKNLITSSTNMNVRNGSGLIYHNLEAKYYILSGDNLERAKKIYTDVVNFAPSRLNVARATYELALIDIKQKNYNEGINKLKKVSELNDTLYIVRNSQKLISKYNNYLNKMG